VDAITDPSGDPEVVRLAADSVTRVVRPAGDSLSRIEGYVELKTAWHPIGT
jgi:hypothetical protein